MNNKPTAVEPEEDPPIPGDAWSMIDDDTKGLGQRKMSAREEIDLLTAQYLAQGGQVHELEQGASAFVHQCKRGRWIDAAGDVVPPRPTGYSLKHVQHIESVVQRMLSNPEATIDMMAGASGTDRARIIGMLENRFRKDPRAQALLAGGVVKRRYTGARAK